MMKELAEHLYQHEQEVDELVFNLANVLEGSEMSVLLPAMATLLIQACKDAEVPKAHLQKYLMHVIEFHYVDCSPKHRDGKIH
jgi:N-acetylglutamate synthase/N-acetylornithine aminotransferase